MVAWFISALVLLAWHICLFIQHDLLSAHYESGSGETIVKKKSSHPSHGA